MKKLRAQHARAYAAWKATKAHRWAAEVARLNLAIMQRCKPVRAPKCLWERGDNG